MTENELSKKIVSSAFLIHKELGPGLLESVYEAILCDELRNNGYYVERQLGIPVVWNGRLLDQAFRIDLLVEQKVVCEIKAVEVIHPVHMSQLLTYLKISDKKLGLLINFNTPLIKHGIRRVVNGL